MQFSLCPEFAKAGLAQWSGSAAAAGAAKEADDCGTPSPATIASTSASGDFTLRRIQTAAPMD